MIAVLLLAGIAVLLAGYFVYGRLIERWLGLDGRRTTPAFEQADGLDYVPAKPAILLGHHFSSIAGAGPIVGPVIAAAAFGWLPAVAWILLGSVLIGGVQDFTALAASLRHGARSVADLARTEISPLARTLFLVFVWLALIYVIVVFVDLTSSTFVHDPGVASSSLGYIFLAVALGLLVYRAGIGLGRASAVFVPLVFVTIWAGQALPLEIPVAEALPVWSLLLLGYCLLASVLPVWLLLQPRDYLSSFLLYACLGGGVVGVLFGGGRPAAGVEPLPAFLGWTDANLGLLFPAMFITIACGACSGFHSIVASGTTAKQISSEAHARPVAYGGMLLEAVLALLAVAAVILVGAGESRGMAPTVVFSQGMGHILSALGLRAELGAHFGALAISTFLLTTLDTCTRLARYVAEELLGLPRGRWWSVVAATLATLAIPAWLTQVTLHLPDGTPAPAWRVIWPVFGATNQLLGALAMLAITIWLRNQGRRRAYVALPMLFMFVVTLIALGQLIARYTVASIVGGIATGLLLLSLVLLAEAIRHLLTTPAGRGPEPAAAQADGA